MYLRWGYHGGIADTDRVYVARADDHIVGLVRRAQEGGTLMLRGMHVAPEYERRRTGTRLLRAFVRDLPATDCYCIPFAHLTGFYSQVGFSPIADAEGGEFLLGRIRHYRAEGHNVILMRRTAR
jgi:predicted N-acetyltransferase YhbS